MRSESEIREEFEILKRKEKEELELLKEETKEGDMAVIMDRVSSMMILSSVLSYTLWLLEESELRFSTLLDIEEVSRKGIAEGKPPQDVLEFAWNKIKDLGEKKN